MMGDPAHRSSLPGSWLLAVARLLFDDAVITSVVKPTIADLRQEFLEAGSDQRKLLRARWRGYVAFWSLVVMAPVAFRNWPGRRQHPRAFLKATALVVVAIGIVAVWRTTMHEVLGAILEGIPESMLGALGAAGSLAFIAGPLAFLAMVVGRRTTQSAGFHFAALEAGLVSLLSVTVAAVLASAGHVATLKGIGQRGSAGMSLVAHSVNNAAQPMFYAVIALAACLLVGGIWALRTGHRSRAAAVTSVPRISGATAFGLSAMLAFALLAVDQLLRVHHEMMNGSMILLNPARLKSVDIRAVIAGVEESTGLLLVGGMLLTLVVLTFATITRRVTRSKQMHPVLGWTSSVALVVAVAGAAWHISVLNATLETIHSLPGW